MRTVLLALLVTWPTVAGAQHPLDTLAPGHWMVLSENTLSDVDPCPMRDCSYSGAEGQPGLVNDWVGAAFATEHGMLGALVVWGGGHGGYWGSEVYAFDVETRVWARLSEPFPDGDACNMTTGLYPDGSPCPAHTYDAVEYHPGTNSFVTLASETNHSGGYFNDTPSMFDLDARAWRTGCERADGRGITGAGSAYDASRDLIWFVGAYNQRVASYDVDTCTWTQYEEHNVDIDIVTAIDPVHDLLVTIDGRGANEVFAHQLARPELAATTLTVTGDTEVMDRGANGFEWDPITMQFVAWVDGAAVYALTPPTGDPLTGTWRWTRVDPAPTNTVVPVRNGNGNYSRFRYVPSKNVFIAVSSTDGPVWAYRLSAELPPPRDAGTRRDVGPATDTGMPTDVPLGADAPGADVGTSTAGCGCRAGHGRGGVALLLAGVLWTLGRHRPRR